MWFAVNIKNPPQGTAYWQFTLTNPERTRTNGTAQLAVGDTGSLHTDFPTGYFGINCFSGEHEVLYDSERRSLFTPKTGRTYVWDCAKNKFEGEGGSWGVLALVGGLALGLIALAKKRK